MRSYSCNSQNNRNLLAGLRCGCGNFSPFYNGPCPDANGCWGGCGGPAAERRCGCPLVKGAFVCPVPLNVIAGASIPLSACGRPSGIDCVGGTVEVEEKGVYYAAYSLTVPAGTTMTTTLTPTLNGAVLQAGVTEVDTAEAGDVPVFSGQVIFAAEDGDRFAITSSEALAMPASPAPALSVELMRITDTSDER